MVGKIAKLLKRQILERPEVAEAIAQLGHLAEAQPDLSQAASLQAALLRAMYAEPAPVAPYNLTAAEATARLTDGIPLLRHSLLPCTQRHVREAFLRLCVAAGRASIGATTAAHSAPPFQVLTDAVRKGHLDLWAYGNMLLADTAQALPSHLEEQGYAAELVMTLLRLALLPFLEQTAAQLSPLCTSQPWNRGYCPMCGAWPVLAEQRSLEQRRYLRCGLCASSWEVDRLLCPFCANRDHLLLGYLQVEGEEDKRRIATCEACRGYLKLLSTLAPLTTPHLLVAEVALVHLDLIAMEKGYIPPL